jgi:DNA-directed RNA polymerase specialized sigma24 family protein
MSEIRPDSAETCLLLEQVQTGDRRAFDRLFARYRAYLIQVVETRPDPRLLARLDASDAVQEAQMEVYRRLPDFLARRPMLFRLCHASRR